MQRASRLEASAGGYTMRRNRRRELRGEESLCGSLLTGYCPRAWGEACLSWNELGLADARELVVARLPRGPD